MKKNKSAKNLADLQQRLLIKEADRASLEQVTQKFNLLVTPTMLDCVDHLKQEDPIARQFLPDPQELVEQEQELGDPTGDALHEVVKGVVHRYPDRCLIKVASVCPVYCRFCFRKEMIGPRQPSLTQQELAVAYDYIRNQPAIWEVILTGGDPLILKPRRIAAILSSLSDIAHVDIIRIHTRVPVVDPERISLELIKALKVAKTVYVVLHANHPQEFTPAAISACAALVDAGIPMLSQSVLLKGVNDSATVLAELMKAFVRNRIKPYYLHHPDLAKGTGHFRLKVKEGQRLMKTLRAEISGLCQPTYMLEIPGGGGKVPISPCYLTEEESHWLVKDFAEGQHVYEAE